MTAEHLFTFGTFKGSHIEFGCCQICGAVVVISGREEPSTGLIGPKEGTGLNVTLTAEDHLAWHGRTEPT